MSSEPIVLFDIPSKGGRGCWSYNPWKTRLLLNYKGLDYRTEWLEYPDIKTRLEGHVPPIDDDIAYTIPTIRLPTGEYIMDSRAIASALEAQHPSPPLHLDSPEQELLQLLMRQTLGPLFPIFLARVPRVILNEASVPYWMETRKGWIGMSVDEYEKLHPAEGCYEGAGPGLKEVTALLTENGEGPFFRGKEVSYADFVWGSLLLYFARLGEDVFENILGQTGDAAAHRALLKGLEPWTQRCAE